MYTDVLLALSNLFFLLPFFQAIYKHRWTRAIIFFLLVFVSGFYHACYSEMDLCFVSHAIHHHLDFFFSNMLIPLTGLYFINFGKYFAFLERWLIVLTGFAIFLVVVDPNVSQEVLQYTLLGITTLLVLIGCILNWKEFEASYVATGLLFTLIAFVFFVLSQQRHDEYWLLHGFWHVFAAIGQYYILGIRKAAPRYAAMDSRITPIISI